MLKTTGTELAKMAGNSRLPKLNYYYYLWETRRVVSVGLGIYSDLRQLFWSPVVKYLEAVSSYKLWLARP